MAIKHKHQFVCQECDSCFDDLSCGGHECYNVVPLYDVYGVLPPQQGKVANAELVTVQLDKIRMALPALYEREDYFFERMK